MSIACSSSLPVGLVTSELLIPMPSVPQNLKDAVEFPMPPGWGYIGKSFLGSLNGIYGVTRIMEPGLYAYSAYPGSPWKINPKDSTQLFVALQRKFVPSEFGTLFSLATTVHTQGKSNQTAERATTEVFILAGVVKKLLRIVKQLQEANVRLRLLEPTNIVYRCEASSKTLTEIPDVDVWLPDAGFAYIGLPGSDNAVPDHLNLEKRWGKGKQLNNFSWLWADQKLLNVDNGLSLIEEKVAVSRMIAWVMDGERRTHLPKRDAADSASRQFWNSHSSSIWLVLEKAIGTEALSAKTVPENFFDELLKTSVGHHFVESRPIAKSPRKIPLAAIGTVVFLAGAIGAGAYFRQGIAESLKPIPKAAPLAICPECTEESSPELFSKLDELQKSFLELNAFEERFIPLQNRLKTEELSASVSIPRPSSNRTEEGTFADTKEYLKQLSSTASLLSSVREVLATSQEPDRKQVEECLKEIAGSLEAHLYQVADAVRTSASMDNGLSERGTIEPMLKEISETISRFVEISEKTKTCLRTIY